MKDIAKTVAGIAGIAAVCIVAYVLGDASKKRSEQNAVYERNLAAYTAAP